MNDVVGAGEGCLDIAGRPAMADRLVVRTAVAQGCRFDLGCHQLRRVAGGSDRLGDDGGHGLADGLDLMVDDHLERLSRREGALGRSFRAAIAFARSSNETSRGRYLAAVGHLMESFVLAPVRNEAFRIILWPFLRRKCLGTMPR